MIKLYLLLNTPSSAQQKNILTRCQARATTNCKFRPPLSLSFLLLLSLFRPSCSGELLARRTEASIMCVCVREFCRSRILFMGLRARSLAPSTFSTLTLRDTHARACSGLSLSKNVNVLSPSFFFSSARRFFSRRYTVVDEDGEQIASTCAPVRNGFMDGTLEKLFWWELSDGCGPGEFFSVTGGTRRRWRGGC